MVVSPGGGRFGGIRKKSLSPATVEELLGIALGGVGLSLSDFCDLSVTEFEETVKAWTAREEARSRDAWERTRTHAAISIQPHLAKGKRLTPEKLLPFPWDKERKRGESKGRKMTAEEQRGRMAALAEKFKDY